mmetsp:Transcript_9031/g.23410  ORF Transcript_9031/g.23410 Transcript_9031/m.23410 type:complete len:399 (-) Transcript_9031:135-1331(-)
MAMASPAGFVVPGGHVASPAPLKVAGAGLPAPEVTPRAAGAKVAVVATVSAAAAALAVRRSRVARRGRRSAVARRFADEERCSIVPELDPELAAESGLCGLKDSWEPRGATLDPAIAKRLAPASEMLAAREIAALGVRLNAELANGRLKFISSAQASALASPSRSVAGAGAGCLARGTPVGAAGPATSRRRIVSRVARAAASEEAEETAEATPKKATTTPAERPDAKEDFPFDGVEEPEFDVTKEVGVTEPLGFFDPAGFCKDVNKEEFRKLRASEIKHGRVAMMASAGAVVEHYIKIPGFDRAGPTWESKFNAIVSVPGAFIFPIFIIGLFLVELSIWAQDENLEPGNFGDPLGLGMYDTEMRNRELNNGRAAMFAAAGIIVAQIVTGKDAVQQLGL